MPEYVCFRIGDVFTPGDELATWIATIASAINDAIATGGATFPKNPTGHETYAGRVGVAHFHELGEFLDQTDSVAAFQSFLATLEIVPQQEYASVLATYRQHRSQLAMRANGVFHYPEWNPTRGSMTRGLANAADSLGVVKVEDTIGGRRFMFAEEIVLGAMAHACGGETQLYKTVTAASSRPRRIPSLRRHRNRAVRHRKGLDPGQLRTRRPRRLEQRMEVRLPPHLTKETGLLWDRL